MTMNNASSSTLQSIREGNLPPEMAAPPFGGLRIKDAGEMQCFACKESSEFAPILHWAVLEDTRGNEYTRAICLACLGFYPASQVTEAVGRTVTEFIEGSVADFQEIRESHPDLAVLLALGYPPRTVGVNRSDWGRMAAAQAERA